MEQQISGRYKELAQLYQTEAEKRKIQVRLIAWLRLASFTTIFPVLIYLIPFSQPIGLFTLLALLIVFLWLVKKSIDLGKQVRYYENLVNINLGEVSAFGRDFSGFDGGTEYIDPEHDFSYDLDLFGENSFFQFLNRTVTIEGKNRLAGSILAGNQNPEIIRQRQQAIIELADHFDWRQHFLGSGLSIENNKPEALSGLDNVIELRNTEILKWILRFVPVLTLVPGILWIINVLPNQFFFLAVFVQWMLFIGYARTINKFSKSFGLRTKTLSRYVDLLLIVEKTDFSSVYLNQLKSKLFHEKHSASQVISMLKKILNELDYRQNILVGFVLDSLLLWDIRCIYRLNTWQNSYREDLKIWVEVIAEFDSLISLANLNYNHPQWTIPAFGNNENIVYSRNLGHPLIDTEKRVVNDFNFPLEQHVSIITGANMAGKSTFLRTVGVNLVLAQQGCKVCASEFGFSPVRLFTHMRTTDNLMKDESYFYAELLRIKNMLDQLKNGENLFIIIDEMLKGTNSFDKLNGSVALLKQLIQYQTHCMVATHDLKLTELADQFPVSIRNQCFDVNFQDDELQFDYKLKDGVTGTMNATFLMKKMGIIS